MEHPATYTDAGYREDAIPRLSRPLVSALLRVSVSDRLAASDACRRAKRLERDLRDQAPEPVEQPAAQPAASDALTFTRAHPSVSDVSAAMSTIKNTLGDVCSTWPNAGWNDEDEYSSNVSSGLTRGPTESNPCVVAKGLSDSKVTELLAALARSAVSSRHGLQAKHVDGNRVAVFVSVGGDEPGFTVNGAGSTAANGYYAPCTISNYAGAPPYSNGRLHLLRWQRQHWVIADLGSNQRDFEESRWLYAVQNSDGIPPLGGWETRRASGPAPSLTKGKKSGSDTPLVTVEQLSRALRDAIGIGVPLWNSGDYAGCAAEYLRVVSRFQHADPSLAQAVRDCEGKSTGSAGDSQGWILRRAMDACLERIREGSWQPVGGRLAEQREPTSRGGGVGAAPWCFWPARLKASCEQDPPFPDLRKRDALIKGNELRDAGDNHGAMAMYAHSWVSGFESPAVFNQMALLYSPKRMNNHTHQEILYSAALEYGTDAHKEAFLWYNNRRKARKRTGEVSGAISDCIAGIRCCPDNAKGSAYAQEMREALLDYEGHPVAQIPYPELFGRDAFDKAKALQETEDYKGALAMYLQARESVSDNSPSAGVCFNQMGLMYSKIKDPEGARRLYTQALEVDPDHKEAYLWLNNRRMTQLRLGDNVSARADAREALRRCPDTEKGRAKRQALEKFLAKSD
jgi:tetratricopeptide (TPR) repeat protein